MARSILRPGSNCWRAARAPRVAVLIDGAAYFRYLLQALERARRSVFILGWDLDSRIALDPERPETTRLRRLLPALVAARPELEVRILIWGFSRIYSMNGDVATILGGGWHVHPRLHVEFDTRHPLGGSHHTKLVTIDDRLAFLGGIDLTDGRWDTPDHLLQNPRRVRPSGEPYAPVHDVMIAFDGAAAAAAADHARTRWTLATGREAPGEPVASDPWPPELVPWFVDQQVGLARTSPRYDGDDAVAEVRQLNQDALAMAQRFIYIETQYLTGSVMAEALVRLLERDDGPEILIVVRRRADGYIERFAMGSNRDRMLRRLRRIDRHGRLAVCYPVVAGHEIDVHSKVLVVDDRLLRIGSSNLNNRSMALDTELDAMVEAEDAEAARRIAALRDRLLAEHLDVTPDAVARTLASTGSLLATAQRLNVASRGLHPFDHVDGPGPEEPVTGTTFFDPEEPIDAAFLSDWLNGRLPPR